MSRRARNVALAEWRAAAQRAADAGDYAAAKAALNQAIERDPKNASLRHNLGIVEEYLGNASAAASSYSTALRFDPADRDAAAALVRLVTVASLDAAKLDPAGLKAALALDLGGSQALAAVSLRNRFAVLPDLASASASALVVSKTHAAVQDALMLAALRAGTVCDGDQERIFRSLRRAILVETTPERFRDRALSDLVLALVHQAWNNDFAWAQSPQEMDALERIELDTSALAAGSLEATRNLLLFALYRPLEQIPGLIDAALGIKSKAVRDLFAERLRIIALESEIAGELPRLRQVQDAVSRRVAGQYAESPFPRWRGLHTSAPGVLRTALLRYFPEDRLHVMDEPFDVLIAGTGTGHHALQAALDYGPNARVLAIDLSAPSLAYGERQRREIDVGNVSFMVADILDLGGLGRTFDVIECVGTLHHMADPWAGLRALIGCLAERGLLYLGLYSQRARQHIADIERDPAYPGRGCSAAAARMFRADLLARPEDSHGARIARSPSFWNLNEFRDLVLHEQEHRLTLPTIDQALRSHDLAFRGFTLDRKTLTRFGQMFPGDNGPGTLAQWDQFEAANPSAFAGMFCFWCDRD